MTGIKLLKDFEGENRKLKQLCAGLIPAFTLDETASPVENYVLPSPGLFTQPRTSSELLERLINHRELDT